jgi:hypothetical protein
MASDRPNRLRNRCRRRGRDHHHIELAEGERFFSSFSVTDPQHLLRGTGQNRRDPASPDWIFLHEEYVRGGQKADLPARIRYGARIVGNKTLLLCCMILL